MEKENISMGDIEKEEHSFFHFCRSLIKQNIEKYEQEYSNYHRKAIDLHQALKDGDTELYNQLMITASLEEQAGGQLRKSKAAFDKPYFGRIDFKDIDMNREEKIYIGKSGIIQNKTDVIVADWRAPVSSIYYENELGRGMYSFYSPLEAKGKIEIEVDLQLKRNYDMKDGELKGYYDSDITSHDELLIHYLSQNKEAVLGEIIATIQKEQNEIIRESPFVNQIVQGVAGSGKTTVAMHRISYILYNYKERFLSNEFCIIGGSDLLLRYITSGLPELDVYNVKQMKQEQMLIHLLKKEWKKNYRCTEPFEDAKYRCKAEFIKKLEEYLEQYKQSAIPFASLKDNELGVLFTKSAAEALYGEAAEYSLKRLLMIMDEKVQTRIASFSYLMEPDKIKKKKKEYRNYYKDRMPRGSIYTIYKQFLCDYILENNINDDQKHLKSIEKGCFDIYDLSALVMIYYSIFQKEKDEEFGQIFIDEAQDFGSGVYYVLRRVLPQCYFTIMGDVSQNINYDTGMNDWEELKEVFLTGKGDKFKLLSKSYRNTIEISEYADTILDKASCGAYKIEPVIRHGAPVTELNFWSEQELVEFVAKQEKQNLKKGYTTFAVICRNDDEADRVEEALSQVMTIYGSGCENFTQGTMVLPVRMTKGLEFDSVVLWNPKIKQSLKQPDEAKLLYVAVTRALHELYVLNC